MFLTIQDGGYTININLISEIDWVSETEATVTMVSGSEYTVEEDDLIALKAKLGM